MYRVLERLYPNAGRVERPAQRPPDTRTSGGGGGAAHPGMRGSPGPRRRSTPAVRTWQEEAGHVAAEREQERARGRVVRPGARKLRRQSTAAAL